MQGLASAVPVVLEVVAVRTEHAKTTVRIPERDRDCPEHVSVVSDLLIALPAHIRRGIADTEYRIQEQIERAGARTDDQVCSRQCALEAFSGSVSEHLNAQQQRDADRDGADGERYGRAAISQTQQSKAQHGGAQADSAGR